MRRDTLIVGLVGIFAELALSDRLEPISVVLFALLALSSLISAARPRDVLVTCLVGLVWETIFSHDRHWVTAILFALPLVRLVAAAGASQQRLRGGLAQLRGRIGTRAFVAELVGSAAVLALGVGAAVFLMQGLGVSRRIIGDGALAFALGAVGFKGVLYAALVVPVLHPRLAPRGLAIAQGSISAVSELGAAALFFRFVDPALSILELIAFGAAAGIVEAVVLPLMSLGGIGVLSGTPVESTGDEWQEKGATPAAVMIFPVVERALTMWLHVASRVLVYAGVLLGSVVPVALSLVVFAGVDGLGYYALLKKWKVFSFAVAIKFYAGLALAAGFLTFVSWLLRGSLR